MFTQGIPSEEWDQTLAVQDGHILQSRDWGKFQEALGRKVVYEAGSDWSWLGAVRKGRGVKYLMISYGPTFSANADFSQIAASMLEAAHKLKLDFVRFEPQGKIAIERLLDKGAFKFSDIQPSRTWILDLDPTSDELKSAMASGHRNSINGADKRGLTFRQGQGDADMAVYLKMLKATSGKGFKPHPEPYYRKLMESFLGAQLFFCDLNGQPIAAAIGLDFGNTRYYFQAVSAPEAKAARASVPLVWFMLKDAKAKDLKLFDFWGIAPTDDPRHPWTGFSEFKKAFGGRPFETLGTWDIPLKKAKYSVYQVAKRFL